MSLIGPQLPPELQKRKRSDDQDDTAESSDSSTAPAPPPPRANKPSPSSTKRARVVGSAPPPAPLEERPTNDPQQNDEPASESDDDDFGPSLPSATNAANQSSARSAVGLQMPAGAPAAALAKRDEWMTLAPTDGDWSSRVDPTKLKNRKFNTGRGAKGPSQSGKGGDASWHETPEQKQERLRREVMGIKDTTAATASSSADLRHGAYDDATARRLKEFNVRLALVPTAFLVLTGLTFIYADRDFLTL